MKAPKDWTRDGRRRDVDHGPRLRGDLHADLPAPRLERGVEAAAGVTADQLAALEVVGLHVEHLARCVHVGAVRRPFRHGSKYSVPAPERGRATPRNGAEQWWAPDSASVFVAPCPPSARRRRPPRRGARRRRSCTECSTMSTRRLCSTAVGVCGGLRVLRPERDRRDVGRVDRVVSTTRYCSTLFARADARFQSLPHWPAEPRGSACPSTVTSPACFFSVGDRASQHRAAPPAEQVGLVPLEVRARPDERDGDRVRARATFTLLARPAVFSSSSISFATCMSAIVLFEKPAPFFLTYSLRHDALVLVDLRRLRHAEPGRERVLQLVELLLVDRRHRVEHDEERHQHGDHVRVGHQPPLVDVVLLVVRPCGGGRTR